MTTARLSEAGDPPRSPVLGPREFDRIREMIHKRAGIVLSPQKQQMVTSRLARRLKALKMPSFEAYLSLIEQPGSPEAEHFVNALTTNLTSFFREPHHFQYLAGPFMEEMARRKSDRTLRIWSAGCSTGEEPYSIAMALMGVLPRGWDLKILATDLDSQVVATAREGVYDAQRIDDVEDAVRRRFFLAGRGDQQGLVRVAAPVRRHISFRTLNLLEPWPFRGPLDAIFCRNVVIYFSKETQRPLFDRFADVLEPDGHLFIGHSETLYRVTERFHSAGRTIYRRSR